MVTATRETKGDWRIELAGAAMRQGPSFVTLLLILYGVWHFGNYIVQVGIPAHLLQIQHGYQTLQRTHDANLERLIATFATEQDRLGSVIVTLEGLVENRAILDEHKQLLLRILEELRQVAQSKGPAAGRAAVVLPAPLQPAGAGGSFEEAR